MIQTNASLIQAVAQAMQRPEALQRIGSLHTQIADRVQQIGPVCRMSGRCCRFQEYGHRLFITTLELAAFAVQLRQHPELHEIAMEQDGGGCRFQNGRQCMAHLIRPMGCRLFFCDTSSESAMQALYEEMHRKVKDLHDQFGIAYYYVEWREGLRAIDQSLVIRHLAGFPRP